MTTCTHHHCNNGYAPVDTLEDALLLADAGLLYWRYDLTMQDTPELEDAYSVRQAVNSEDAQRYVDTHKYVVRIE